MAVLLTPPYLQFLDDNGAPVANGFVYTYIAGTTTPKATYTDNTASTQNTNPIQLDSSGIPQPNGSIWIEGSYKIVVTDADGATISTTDNVTSFSAQVTNTEGFFQSFSGNGSTTAFTLSDDLGTDEKALMIFVDAGLQNIVTNGTFATDSGWTKGTGWTIGAGVATATGAISTAIEQNSAVTLVAGQNYVVTMTITRSAGSLTASVGGTAGTARSSAGTFTETITAGSTQVLAFTGSGFTGTLDNVTITPAVSAGYNIQNPSAYTVNGTALTFATAPPTGTNNIYVFAPYTLIGAAGAAQTAADAAAASALAAASSAADAANDANDAQAAYTSTAAAIAGIADMNVDLFTGDGVTTAFVLSGEPGDENNTWVSVSGLVISTAAYSLSGATLTFSAAPANLAPIVIRWGVPIGASVADGSVTAIKLASNAVETAKILNNNVTNAKLAQVATATFKGRTTAGSGNVEDLTVTQATAMLDVFGGDSGSGGVKGLVPATIAGDATKYLKGDGTWASVSGGSGTVTSVTGSGGLTGSVTTSGNITIDTNNSLGVGSYAILQSFNATVANGSTTAGSNLKIVKWTSTGTLTAGSSPSGTWRNVSGGSLSTGGDTGLFIRTA